MVHCIIRFLSYANAVFSFGKKKEKKVMLHLILWIQVFYFGCTFLAIFFFALNGSSAKSIGKLFRECYGSIKHSSQEAKPSRCERHVEVASRVSPIIQIGLFSFKAPQHERRITSVDSRCSGVRRLSPSQLWPTAKKKRSRSQQQTTVSNGNQFCCKGRDTSRVDSVSQTRYSHFRDCLSVSAKL